MEHFDEKKSSEEKFEFDRLIDAGGLDALDDEERERRISPYSGYRKKRTILRSVQPSEDPAPNIPPSPTLW